MARVFSFTAKAATPIAACFLASLRVVVARAQDKVQLAAGIIGWPQATASDSPPNPTDLRSPTESSQYYGKSYPALNGLTPSQQAAAIVAKGPNGVNNTGWVGIQQILNNFSTAGTGGFIQPQYLSLETYSTMGYSNYRGFSASLRERLGTQLTFDVNYTLSKSMDDGSTLEGGDGGPNYGGLILNAYNPSLNYAVSDFDVRHVLNANFVAGVPLGRGQRFGGNLPRAVDALVGGWQLTGVARFQTGLPFSIQDQLATSLQQNSHAVLTRPLKTKKSIINGVPYIISDPTYAYQSFRNARAGEVGSRNVLRMPQYEVLDAGLDKAFHIPHTDAHQLEVRWEVFDVMNTQPFGTLAYANTSQNPYANNPTVNFGQFSGSHTPVGETRPGRLMQFGARYSF